jgi:drug/metabolite transporter (DMT)-like permease
MNTATKSNTLAWTLFVCGLSVAALISVIQAFLGWERKTYFGDHVVRPLLIAGFCSSAISPFFAVRGPHRWKWVALAMLSYLITFAGVLLPPVPPAVAQMLSVGAKPVTAQSDVATDRTHLWHRETENNCRTRYSA